MVVLHIQDEVSPLTDLCVCLGSALPDSDTWSSDHPQHERFRMRPWDRHLFVDQQHRFWEVCERHGVNIHEVTADPALPWQAYTRDTGFVVGDTLFYAADRGLPERVGEIDRLGSSLPAISDHMVEITAGRIEGGDVLVDDGMTYVGISARTDRAAADELGRHVEVVPLWLGPNVMHLDVRMTILPGRRLLICPDAFVAEDLAMLERRFTLLPVTADEGADLGTNVFVIDPETVVVHAGHTRIASMIEEGGLRVERVDYSEPVAILGSFRCSTMPLARSS